MTFAEIGAALGVSRWRAQQIHDRALSKLKKECKRLGICAADVIGRARGESMLAGAELWAFSENKSGGVK